jgi:hypothetical protein
MLGRKICLHEKGHAKFHSYGAVADLVLNNSLQSGNFDDQKKYTLKT